MSSSNHLIGRFQVKAEVGRGGMGVVYRCYDPDHNHDVALKLLAAHLVRDPIAAARFQREASLISTLQHPHIALFHEVGEHEGLPYIALEWIDGYSLKELLAREGHIPLDRGLTLLTQLVDALDYAHKRGVVHRDLKPANIMIGDGDYAILVDFGLALLEKAPSITTTNLIIGTPLYMSPEQIEGKSLDGRSDQYSLAIIVYEMLAGKPPFTTQSTSALYHQQLNVLPPPITQINPALTTGIEAALNKALAKDPDDRFASLAEFSQAMHRPHAPTTSTVNPAQPQPKRMKAWLRGVHSEDQPENQLLDKDNFLIGRYPPADLVIPLPRISRQHARIVYRDFSYYLTDLGSRNGTFVNGQPLAQQDHRLNNGDEIVLGGAVSFHFFDPEETTHGPRLGRLKGIWIDEKLNAVWIDAQLVDPPLSLAQFTLLAFLYQQAGQIVSRDDIITAVWPDVDETGVSSEAVDGLIKRLRKRLRQVNPQQEYIEVIRGHGLRLFHPD